MGLLAFFVFEGFDSDCFVGWVCEGEEDLRVSGRNKARKMVSTRRRTRVMRAGTAYMLNWMPRRLLMELGNGREAK